MDLIKRQDVIDATNSEMVDTNPYHFKSNEKFIEFMDDSNIASFGKWQWSNGFNTALVAANIQLEKLPPVPQWIPCNEKLPEENNFYLATIYTRVMQTAFCDILFYGAPQLCEDKKVGWYFMLNGDVEQVFNVIAWMPLPEPWKGSDE